MLDITDVIETAMRKYAEENGGRVGIAKKDVIRAVNEYGGDDSVVHIVLLEAMKRLASDVQVHFQDELPDELGEETYTFNFETLVSEAEADAYAIRTLALDVSDELPAGDSANKLQAIIKLAEDQLRLADDMSEQLLKG